MNYNHLNISEYIVISQLYASRVSIREIAKQLNRSPSTISYIKEKIEEHWSPD